MLKTQDKTFNAILKALAKDKVEVKKAGSGHYKVYTPKGIIVLSASPRNKNTHKRAIARLRKMGVNI